LARPAVRGTFSQPGPSRPAAAVRLARTLGLTIHAHYLTGHRQFPVRARASCSFTAAPNLTMRFVVPACLLIVAIIHALPLVGVVSAAKVATLYGISVQDPNLEILLRHRAALFGLLAAFLAYAAFHRSLHGLALVAGWLSVSAFLALAFSVGGYNHALSVVIKADILAALALVVGTIVHLRTAGEA
jgi:hypothetical protein